MAILFLCRLFADFFQSDIIIASPLALATKLEEDARSSKAAETDFLSSIDLLIIDRADAMSFQVGACQHERDGTPLHHT